MSRADLTADFEAALHDAISIFNADRTSAFDEDIAAAVKAAGPTGSTKEENLSRMLNIAALDFSRYRQRHMYGQLALQAGVNLYPAPDDLYLYIGSDWGRQAARDEPWNLPRALRHPMVVELLETGVPAQRLLRFSPGPTSQHLIVFGVTFPYSYDARHVIGDDATGTTIRPEDRDLLLLRAVTEALREISLRDAWKPGRMRDGLNASPRNQTMSALYEKFRTEWDMRINRVAA
ncbi:hypothetical protein [Paraburkholderia adhaesiva]|uniref:hypothetical protein n=1 Tax=Paraburkholderia adhaesiva TaxID=2883244 RepID=UPI001F3A6259|nr:hypothetical protein [Paraburkholderia adhaesiva]